MAGIVRGNVRLLRKFLRLAELRCYAVCKGGDGCSLSHLSDRSGSQYYESPRGKTFLIEKTMPEKAEEFVEFMYANFIPQHQLCAGLGITPSDPTLRLLTERRVKRWISSGASCSATDVATGDLAAASFCHVITPEDRNVYGEDLENLSPQVIKMQKIFAILEDSVDVFEDLNVGKVLEMAAVAVNSDYEGNNLSNALAKENWRLGRAMGCEASIFHSTNIRTQAILQKIAQLRFTLDLKTLRIDGERVLNLEAMNGTECAQIFVKDLRDHSAG